MIFNTNDDAAQNKNSVVNERAEHFRQEKKFLANIFGDYLMERLKSLDVGKVILFIDAGSTLQPILHRLAAAANDLKKDGKDGGADWIDNVVVVTNNFSGFQQLLTDYIPAEKRKSLSAETALRVVLLPGRILPAYDAIVGFENRYLGETLGSALSSLKPYHTIREIRRQVDENNATGDSEIKIISLVTGNWIRIRNRPPTIPVPLARGAGHLAIKREMISAADEVFVIAPLGKIFVKHDKAVINEALSKLVNPSASSTYKHSYKELDTVRLPPHFDGRRMSFSDKKIKLVTTRRGESSILHIQSDKIFEKLSEDSSPNQEKTPFPKALYITEKNKENEKFKFSVNEIDEVPHMIFEFDPMEAEKLECQELERQSAQSKNHQNIEDLIELNSLGPGVTPLHIWNEIRTEFPHKSTRVPEMLDFFFVDKDKIALGTPLLTGYNSKEPAFLPKVKEICKIAVDRGAEFFYYDRFRYVKSYHHIVIASLNDRPVGWGAFRKLDKCNSTDADAEITMMYVLSAYRRGSIADEVLKAMENIMSILQLRNIILTAKKGQENSLEFYRHNGYQEMAAEKPAGTAKTGIIHMGKNLPVQALDIAHIKPNAENYADFLENLQMSFNTNDEILPYFFRALKNDEKKLEIIYARIENEIAGWCAFTNDAENNLLEMAALYIRPAYRRTGIATEIFDKLENETEKNSRKIRFYAPEEKDSKSSPAYMEFFSSRGYRDTTTLLNRYLGKIKHVKKELSK